MASPRIRIRSVIAGIHRTKIGSHPSIELVVEADDTIAGIDPNCMLVRLPPLEQLSPDLHHVVTYPKSRNPSDPRKTDQLALNVAGKKVENIPANLCG